MDTENAEHNKIMEAVGNLSDTVGNLSDTVGNLSDKVDEILEAIGHFSNKTEEHFDRIENRLDNMDVRMGNMDVRMGNMEGDMVTKDYLDKKFFDSKDYATTLIRKEDGKLVRTVDKLEHKRVFSSEDAQEIKAMEPFPVK